MRCINSRAEAIVAEELARFTSWHRSRRAIPTVVALRQRFDDILAPTVPLSRHIFKAPTRFYKTGVVFMAWLNGHQEHFVMVGGQQSARSVLHDPDLAAARMSKLLSVHGLA